jgi:LmbE family N-acetylglucosaminyl deacetylase
MSISLPRPERLLVVAAHPLDADRAIGGTVAGWVEQGTVAALVCCTSGDGRSEDASADPLELAAVREREQRLAAQVIGYESVTFMHRPEGAVANDLALREQLVRINRTIRPDAEATHDPDVLISVEGYLNHVDHRAAGVAAVDAVAPAAGNAMAFPHLVRSDGLEPHEVARLFLFWSDRAAEPVQIGGALEAKTRALAAHASQTGAATVETTETLVVIDVRR